MKCYPCAPSTNQKEKLAGGRTHCLQPVLRLAARKSEARRIGSRVDGNVSRNSFGVRTLQTAHTSLRHLSAATRCPQSFSCAVCEIDIILLACCSSSFSCYAISAHVLCRRICSSLPNWLAISGCGRWGQRQGDERKSSARQRRRRTTPRGSSLFTLSFSLQASVKESESRCCAYYPLRRHPFRVSAQATSAQPHTHTQRFVRRRHS